MTKKLLIFIGGLLLIVGLSIPVYAFGTNYNEKRKVETPLIFSEHRLLLELWSTYKKSMLEPDSLRTLDRENNNITTSEGQGYTLLRAAWMDDKQVFDTSWQWTKDNLQRDDKLFASKFGELPNGSYGIRNDIGGQNTASDGDTDIALALLMAYSRWNEPGYLYDAKPIIENIWDQEVVIVNKKPVMAANNLQNESVSKVLINPSYFAPYAYKIFAKVDTKNNWLGLSDNSYSLLNQFSESPLDTVGGVGLTPNWITLDIDTGVIVPTTQKTLNTNYGYEAFRTMFRMALDYNWNKDTRAKEVLAKHSFLADQWQSTNKLSSVYTHKGEVASNAESPAAYGANLAYFEIVEPQVATEIYEQKLLTLYNPDVQSWRVPLNYYDDNWAWFGIALHNGHLENLTEQQQRN